MSSFYSDEELLEIGFKSFGKNVMLSRKASIYSPQSMVIGDNVRIDDYCILSGKITLGSHIHVSAYVALYGAMGIVMEDYSGISAQSVVYSAMDDFSGDFLIGPVHPEGTTNVTGGEVRIGRYVQIGVNTIIFPNVDIGEGSVVGAFSLVKESLKPWNIYAGIPCRFIKLRNKKLLEFVTEERKKDAD